MLKSNVWWQQTRIFAMGLWGDKIAKQWRNHGQNKGGSCLGIVSRTWHDFTLDHDGNIP
jgi:hypothetical protein